MKQKFQSINGRDICEFLEWYEFKYQTQITKELTEMFPKKELENLTDEFVKEHPTPKRECRK